MKSGRAVETFAHRTRPSLSQAGKPKSAQSSNAALLRLSVCRTYGYLVAPSKARLVPMCGDAEAADPRGSPRSCRGATNYPSSRVLVGRRKVRGTALACAGSCVGPAAQRSRSSAVSSTTGVTRSLPGPQASSLFGPRAHAHAFLGGLDLRITSRRRVGFRHPRSAAGHRLTGPSQEQRHAAHGQMDAQGIERRSLPVPLFAVPYCPRFRRSAADSGAVAHGLVGARIIRGPTAAARWRGGRGSLTV